MTLADDFETCGYVSPVDVMPASEATDLRARLEQIEHSRGGRLTPVLNSKAHLIMPFLWDVVHDPRILDPVRAVLGEDVLCWGSSFFSKDPGSPDDVPLHQDSTVWGLNEQCGLTAWLALSPSTAETGCMRMAPGSHKTKQKHVIRDQPSSMLPLGEQLQSSVRDEDMVLCPLDPGQMSMHHVLAVHGSLPNRSTDIRRIGFAIRYIPGHVAQVGEQKGFATLVSGRDHGTFELEQQPEADFAPEALRRHQRIIATSARRVIGQASQLEKELP